MHTILGGVVFQAALELRSQKEWIFHSNVKASVDSYLDNEPSYALRLQGTSSTNHVSTHGGDV